MKKKNNIYSVEGRVATMELTRGKSMRVDKADLPLLTPYGWHAVLSHNKRTWYATAWGAGGKARRQKVQAHRLLVGLDFGDPRQVDHWDGDGLNNLRSNLRLTNHTGNAWNQHGKKRRRADIKPTSRFPGVYWCKAADKWVAMITLARRTIYLARYDDELDSAAAYLRAKAVRDAGGTVAEIKAVA